MTKVEIYQIKQFPKNAHFSNHHKNGTLPWERINLTKTWHQNLQIKVHTIGLLMGDDGQSPENKTQLVAFLKSMADVTDSTFRILE